ncbi:MAG: hypothetical protein ACK5JL_02695 [Candidatus Kapaibacterium sp.]
MARSLEGAVLYAIAINGTSALDAVGPFSLQYFLPPVRFPLLYVSKRDYRLISASALNYEIRIGDESAIEV